MEKMGQDYTELLQKAGQKRVSSNFKEPIQETARGGVDSPLLETLE